MVLESKLYKVLSVSEDASLEEIKKAYKLGALKCHPDKNKHATDATEKFKELTEAYEILSDSSKRKIYDNFGILGIQRLESATSAPSADPSQANYTKTATYFRGNSSSSFFTSNTYHSYDGSNTGTETRNQEFLNSIVNSVNSIFGSSSNPSSAMTSPVNGTSINNYNNVNDMASNLHSNYANNVAGIDGGAGSLKKGSDIKHQLDCTLEDLFTGKQIKLMLSKQSKCKTCNSSGFKPGVDLNSVKCKTCEGTGKLITKKMLGLMVHQMQVDCDDCQGSGITRIMDQNLLCASCKGSKFVPSKKILNIDIPPGTKHNDSIVFRNEADEASNMIPGDIIITVNQTKHSDFIRKNDDLVLIQKIDLLTALAGGSFNFKYLNNKVIKVNLDQNEIIKPGSIKVLKNFGMPKTAKPDSFGDLFIKFEVEFPKEGSITNSNRKLLSEILPERSSSNYSNYDLMSYTTSENDEKITEEVGLMDIDEDRYHQYRKKQKN